MGSNPTGTATAQKTPASAGAFFIAEGDAVVLQDVVMETALAAVATRPGAAHLVTRVEPVLLPPRAPGSVRLRMLAAPINPSDLITIAGTYSRTVFPFRPGFEGVGEVVEADGDAGLRLGSRVVPVRSAGSWSSVRDVAVGDCIAVPADIPLDQAATSFVNPLTAITAVEQFVTDRRPVVVTAASSTIADHFAALLAEVGAPAVGVVRSSRSRVRRPELWSAIVPSDAEDWRIRLGSAAADAQVVFDAVGGDHAAVVMETLARAKLLVSYGLLSGEPIDTTRLRPRVALRFLHLRALVHDGDPTLLRRRFDRAFALIRGGVLHTDIASTVPLCDITTALEHGGRGGGKTLLRVSGPTVRCSRGR